MTSDINNLNANYKYFMKISSKSGICKNNFARIYPLFHLINDQVFMYIYYFRV